MKWKRLGIDPIKDGGLKLVYTGKVYDVELARARYTIDGRSHFDCVLARHIMYKHTPCGVWVWQDGKEELAIPGTLFIELECPRMFGIRYGIDTTMDYSKDWSDLY